MYRGSFFLFGFLKEIDSANGLTTAIYHDIIEIRIQTYCTLESIEHPDCKFIPELVNHVPKIPLVQTINHISINLKEDTANIEGNQTYFYNQFSVDDPDGPFPLLLRCTDLDEA